MRRGLSRHSNKSTGPIFNAIVVTGFLLQEDGSYLLQEDGSKINITGFYSLAQEDGFKLLQENSSEILV